MKETKPIKGGTTVTIKFTPKINGVAMTSSQRQGLVFIARLVLVSNPYVNGAINAAISTGSVATPPPCCPIDPVGWSATLDNFAQDGSCTVLISPLETYNMSVKLPGGMLRYRMMIEVKSLTSTTGEEYGQDLIIPVVRWATSRPTE